MRSEIAQIEIEIDPLYADTIVRRWQALTGQQAIDAETGVPFADLELRTGAVDRAEKESDQA